MKQYVKNHVKIIEIHIYKHMALKFRHEKQFIGLHFLLQFRWVSGIKELDRKIACESACRCQECQLRDPETLHSSTARSLLVNFLNIVTANIKITHSIKLKGMIDFCINCFKSSLSLKKDSDRIISS